MKGSWDRPVQRAVRLIAGLALLVRANLGLDPWDVFSQGVSRRSGLSLGQVTVLSSVLVLVCWVPLRQRPGVGTVCNVVVVGPVLDLGLDLVSSPRLLLVRAAFLAIAIVGVAVATGLYVGAGWGPGPRDGLMTGLVARGLPVFAARAAIELTVLLAGWALGGQVGVGTVLFALAIGPLVGRCLPPLQIPSREE